jgi:hypothetical protein
MTQRTRRRDSETEGDAAKSNTKGKARGDIYETSGSRRRSREARKAGSTRTKRSDAV